MTMIIEFNERPLSVNHIYGHFKGRTFLLPKVKTYRDNFIKSARAQYRGKPLTGLLSVVALITFGDNRKRDIQNCLKVELDALQGICYEDDSQIEVLSLAKVYEKGVWGIHLEISEV